MFEVIVKQSSRWQLQHLEMSELGNSPEAGTQSGGLGAECPDRTVRQPCDSAVRMSRRSESVCDDGKQ